MKQIVVSGSSAYDILLHFDWSFKEQFSENTDSSVNMSILSPVFHKNHWWTWANICYNLALLWENSILLSSVWEDFSFSDIIRDKINLKYIHKEQFSPSSHSVIISDKTDNRITVFHSGAMNSASESKFSYIEEKIWVSIISANDIWTMLEHAQESKKQGITTLIDPAQQVSQMSEEQLNRLLSYWDILIANHYEFAEIQKKVQKTGEDLISDFSYIIVTYWDQWSQLISPKDTIHIPAITIADIEDTTWAWDAYRAWVLYSIIEWLDIKVWCQLWSILASYSTITSGSQQHHFSFWWIATDMKEKFWIDIDFYSKRKY